MKTFGKGEWKNIAQYVVVTKSPSQVASHAQKFFLRHSSVKEKKRPSILDITLDNDLVSQPIDQHNQAQEIMGFRDNLVPYSIDQHNPIEQLAEKLQPQQLTDFEGSLALLHNDQQSWPPSTMQQLPPSDLLELLSHHVDQEKLIPQLDLQIQQSPHFIDHDNWVSTPNQQFSNDFDQLMLQYELNSFKDFPGTSK